MAVDEAGGDLQGLSQAEAARRLQADGPNELSPPQRRTVWHIVLEVAREPMFQLLVAAGVIYLVLGDLGEAAMLLAFVVLTLGITVAQEQRTERALEALRDLTSPRALVLRDGQVRRIPGREVVLGDLLVVAEGDRVPADALLLQAADLLADESLLTGESVPVGKVAAVGASAPSRPGGDGQPFLYAGTMLVGGQGLARVVAIGAGSEIGRIGRALGEIDTPPTPLQRQTRRLVRVFSVLGLSLSAIVVVLYGLLRGDWLAGLLAGITLAMSMVRPARAQSCGCKSRRELITANEAKRNCMRATECGEEAWSEAASR